MTRLHNGVYAVTRYKEQLLTLLGGSSQPGTQVVVLPPTGEPGDQEWQVEAVGENNVTIRNLRGDTYLGYRDSPDPNELLGGFPEPREWELRPASEPFSFHIVVPGGPVDGVELAVDTSLLRIYPPMTALRPLEIHNPRQAWNFEFHE